MERSAIIVAGGNGKRMRSEIPKQFLEVKGEPLLFHSIRAFHGSDPLIHLVLVLPQEHEQLWKELCEQHHMYVPHQVITGGSERFHSVKAGLDAIEGDGVVAVHDGVRPLLSAALIARCFKAAEEFGSAIPVIPISSSVRVVTGNESRSIDRSTLRAVQTPQCFQIPILKKAFELPFDPTFTDEATLIERNGGKVHLVEGEDRNIKVTTPLDLKVAEALLEP